MDKELYITLYILSLEYALESWPFLKTEWWTCPECKQQGFKHEDGCGIQEEINGMLD